MEEVVAAARWIERILEERPTSGMEQIIQSMQSQIQILTKDLAKAHEQMASQAPAATPTAAFGYPTQQRSGGCPATASHFGTNQFA